MTVADLIGKALPADLVVAQNTDDISISWRRWLSEADDAQPGMCPQRRA